MEITIILESCLDCRYSDHSGAFTPGGAKSICSHPNSPDTFGLGKENPYGWIHRILPDTMEIPEQCPLKNGKRY